MADESNVQGEYNGVPASQAGEKSQTNGSEHTIESRIQTDLIIKRSNGRRAVTQQYRRTHHWTSEVAEFEQRVSKF